MEAKRTKAQVKKNAINVLTQEMISPFAAMNAINKNRNNPEIAELLQMYGISKKMQITDLLSINTGGEKDIFCKLQKVSDIEYLDGNELKVIRIKKNWYEYTPILFTIREFFASLEAAQKVKAEAEKLKAEAEKAEIRKAIKQAEKESRISGKADELAKAIALQYPDMSADKCLEIAKIMLKAA